MVWQRIKKLSGELGNLVTKGQDQKTKVPLSRTAVLEASPIMCWWLV